MTPASNTPSVRLRAWADDFSVGRYHLPQYANPGELKADLLALLDERDVYRDALMDIADPLPVPFRRDPQKGVDAFQKLAREALA